VKRLGEYKCMHLCTYVGVCNYIYSLNDAVPSSN